MKTKGPSDMRWDDGSARLSSMSPSSITRDACNFSTSRRFTGLLPLYFDSSLADEGMPKRRFFLYVLTQFSGRAGHNLDGLRGQLLSERRRSQSADQPLI